MKKVMLICLLIWGIHSVSLAEETTTFDVKCDFSLLTSASAHNITLIKIENKCIHIKNSEGQLIIICNTPCILAESIKKEQGDG